MSIPKIVHYCWFGGGMPDEYKNYIHHWKEMLPEYEFLEWNEMNSDLKSNKFVHNAYQNRKYAFVSDYVRCKVLYEYGGIYLDTDVEVFKSFDDLLDYHFVCGYIWNCLIGTAVILSEKQSPIIKSILEVYEKKEIMDYVPNNHIFTDYFLRQGWFKLDGKRKEHDRVLILPKEAFEIPPVFGHGYCEHHIANSWKEKKKNNSLKENLKKIVPHGLWRQLGAYKALKQNNHYYGIYKNNQ